MSNRNLPSEVELAFEIMPCFALRSFQEPAGTPHPCGYFGKWGTYHSYDYEEEGPPASHDLTQKLTYLGRARLVPEMLSGCRKAPILAVGINPNLPGWWKGKHNSLNPAFDDYRQYAHYFRYRSVAKLELSQEDYVRFGGDEQDTPFSNFTLNVPADEHGYRPIEGRLQPQQMYQTYQGLLEALAVQMGWGDHKLTVGEDLVYGNMVACPSAKWTTRPDPTDPALPPMTDTERDGIVTECFHKRRYFLRQLIQSLPQVILVFSQSTANAFIGELKDRLTEGLQPGEPLESLMAKPVRLVYGELEDGTVLDSRVIFSPHITGNPEEFAKVRDRVVSQLVEQAQAGRLRLNPESGHLARTKGMCSFCPMLDIGPCDYPTEIQPLVRPPELLAESIPSSPLRDKPLQAAMLSNFMDASPSSALGWASSEEAPLGEGGPTLLSDADPHESAESAAFAVPGFLADEVDEDIGPTFVLRGRIVTLNASGDVLDDGRIVVSKGRIVKVLTREQNLPAEFVNAVTIETGGSIFPGLIDLHNHFVYNVLPLWQVPKTYTNRGQWQKSVQYRSNVSAVMKALVGSATVSKAIVRYIEAKAIIGGTTTGQGILTKIRGNTRLFQGAMRNVEATNDARLPEARTHVPNLRTPEDIAGFRKAMQEKRAYFYHLAEGIDPGAAETFQFLVDNDLIQPYLVGIHSLGVGADGLKRLGTAGAKVVWSPFSNLLLYGRTLDLQALKASGATFSIGCDWAPTGSRNLLEELKVARFESTRQGGVLSSQELVAAVTSQAAKVVGWNGFLGSIEEGKLADVIVVSKADGDPYDTLISAREQDVDLVCVHGVARYGRPDIVVRLNPVAGSAPEPVSIGGQPKALNLFAPASGLDDMTFKKARETLLDAMGDLPGLIKRIGTENAHFAALGVEAPQAFGLELDNEIEHAAPQLQDGGEEPDAEFLADVEMPDQVALDDIAVGGESYWKNVEAEPNLPDGLAKTLKGSYA